MVVVGQMGLSNALVETQSSNFSSSANLLGDTVSLFYNCYKHIDEKNILQCTEGKTIEEVEEAQGHGQGVGLHPTYELCPRSKFYFLSISILDTFCQSIFGLAPSTSTSWRRP